MVHSALVFRFLFRFWLFSLSVVVVFVAIAFVVVVAVTVAVLCAVAVSAVVLAKFATKQEPLTAAICAANVVPRLGLFPTL